MKAGIKRTENITARQDTFPKLKRRKILNSQLAGKHGASAGNIVMKKSSQSNVPLYRENSIWSGALGGTSW
jgi:hypothetical protein